MYFMFHFIYFCFIAHISVVFYIWQFRLRKIALRLHKCNIYYINERKVILSILARHIFMAYYETRTGLGPVENTDSTKTRTRHSDLPLKKTGLVITKPGLDRY